MSRAQWTLTALLLAPVAFLTSALRGASRADEPPSARNVAGENSNSDPAAEKSATLPARMTIKILDRVTEKPLDGATLVVFISNNRQLGGRHVADADGRAVLELAGQSVELLSIRVQKKSYVQWHAQWRAVAGKGLQLPGEHVVRLDTGITIGGSVHDGRGGPVAHTQLSASGNHQVSVGEQNLEEGPSFELTVFTDEQGLWQCDHVSADIRDIWIKAKCKGYAPAEYSTAAQAVAKPLDYAALVTKSAKLTLAEGLAVKGRVIDEQGQPVAKARITLSPSDDLGSRRLEGMSDDAGDFRIACEVVGDLTALFEADTFASQERALRIIAGQAPESLDFRLKKGRQVKFHVVDPAGKPVVGAGVRVTRRRMFGAEHSVKTDSAGMALLTSVPEEAATIEAWSTGFRRSDKGILAAGDDEKEIVLHPDLRIELTVIDADTERPIPVFTVIQGVVLGNTSWDVGRSAPRTGHNGRFQGPAQNLVLNDEFRLRVEAAGYLPAESEKLSKSINVDEVRVRLALKAAAPWHGTITSADGTPAAGADVIIVERHEQIAVIDGKCKDRNRIRATTNSEGAFELPAQVGLYRVLVLHATGHADIAGEDFVDSHDVALRTWSRIEGQVKVGAAPGADLPIWYRPDAVENPYEIPINYSYHTKTDSQGRFSFDYVISGPGTVSRTLSYGNGSHTFSVLFQRQKVRVLMGHTVEVTLGGIGRPVNGRFALPPAVVAKFDFGSVGPVQIIPVDDDGRALFNTIGAGRIAADGAFRVDDIPVGRYRLSADLAAGLPRVGNRRDAQIGHMYYDFDVPKMPGGSSDEPFDLGTIVVPEQARLAPGDDAPDFAATTTDGKPLSLAMVRGKLVLLAFSYSDTRQKESAILAAGEELKNVYADFGDDARLAIVEILTHNRSEDAQAYVQSTGAKWTQAWVGPAATSPVSGQYSGRHPRLWLIGPDGKILAGDLSRDELHAAVARALKGL